ncbi:MAG TPA: PIG-L family deacetylase [Candidatus Angelobacter sp.]|nr:PIG-L family deacetylase [Candidatus Angelobacter sp.]
MVLAPHPDDESVATGGVLQLAVSSGAQIRVLYLTDGENNPWAQRATEGRWRISEADQVRWGSRRRREALDALECLGVAASEARFLGFPDQRVTEALLGGTHAAVQRLAEEIEGWRPTVLFMPSLEDRHPDHSGTAIMARLAMARARWKEPPSVFAYVVHTSGAARAGRRDGACVLSGPEREAKRRAILQHASQLRLRRRFLLHFADEPEGFMCGPLAPSVDDAAHPLRLLRATGDRWSFAVRNTLHVAVGRAALHLISQGDGALGSLSATIPRGAGIRPLHRPGSADVIGEVRAHGRGSWRVVTIASPALCHAEFRLAKLDLAWRRSLGFFDGWPWLSFGVEHAQAAPWVPQSSPAGSGERLVTAVES